MPHIAVLSASVRSGRSSHRVALHLDRHLAQAGHSTDLVDLSVLAFPVFEERLKFMKDPGQDVLAFAERIRKADAVILVSPEYNGSFPASLKNVIDLLTEDWKRRPVGICPVSSGSFGGSQVLVGLQFSLWKIKAWVSPSAMQVPNVNDQFQEDGTPNDMDAWDRRTKAFTDDLLWCVEAKRRMEA